jgi:hypothetical protein
MSEHQDRPILLVDGALEGQWHTAPPGTSAVFRAPINASEPYGPAHTDAYQIIDVQVQIGSSVYSVAAGFSRSRIAADGLNVDLKDIEARIILHLFDREAADVLLGGGST